MTNEKIKEFSEAAKPLIKWLNENSNPHATVIVTPSCAELVTGQLNFYTEEFIKD